MIISHLTLKNWRNFREVDVQFSDRVFLVGPNASGKSNLLDVFRFLRDITNPGGLENAVRTRGGISKIRCLAARENPDVEIEIHLSNSLDEKPLWVYGIGIYQEQRGFRRTLIRYEKVLKGDDIILDRPDNNDKKDDWRLTQTSLEQINANEKFRDIARFLESILYLHLIPQLLRHPGDFPPSAKSLEDPFGRSFLERLAKTPEKTRTSRLKKIEKVLSIAVPQLKQLAFLSDDEEGGIPHLEAIYEHWRPKAGKQREDQFSDGTLRLIGLLWSLLEGESLLLLEEPELSLHAAIVKQIPPLMHTILTKSKKRRQVMISTHSADLLSDRSIGAEEVVLLLPEHEGTTVQLVSSVQDIRSLLENGFSVAEAVMPKTKPKNIDQLSLSL
ncbi:MAG: AAA family ATPase [Candidatus Latescibacter sp.]|nr:AAA family ATPase [Candidatus Latescibacter sp.]